LSVARVFLLSPAYAGGERARMIMNERAQFDLARRLRSDDDLPTLGEVFAFLSGLYFRGKLAYAKAFADQQAAGADVLVITPNRGLVRADEPIGVAELKAFAEVDIDEDDPRYRKPLQRDVRRLAKGLPTAEFVLLGSIATGKYIEVLLENFGERLLFPADFVGRGDMSRGGLLLRCAVDRTELHYIPVAGAVRKGKRPPKLEPRRYTK
jgi:hypothetical protein